jgi:hypothetical protein
MMKSNLYLLFFLFLIFGCVSGGLGSDADFKVQLNEAFSLKVNQTAFIESERMLLNFTNVTADSRCPTDVQCVWAGIGAVSVRIKKDEGNTSSHLHTIVTTENRFMNFTDSNGIMYELELIDLKPYPISTKEIQMDEYFATLKVKKK